MSRAPIPKNVERKLFAESMGVCMNPDCKSEIIKIENDIAEKAHIIPYHHTANNSFDNLIILCPNCHTKYDKNNEFTESEVRNWKTVRQEEREKFFEANFSNFTDLEAEIKPLLTENLQLYENYYLKNRKKLWDRVENKIIANNSKIRQLLQNNYHLYQSYDYEKSNTDIVNEFIIHSEEFEDTREDDEKVRSILFPEEINSMFGVSPIKDRIKPSTESLEALISILISNDTFRSISLEVENPYIEIVNNGKVEKINLDDTPRLNQLYFTYKCFKPTKVRLDSLNFALKYLKKNGINPEYNNLPKLTSINANGINLIFVYEYCLTQNELYNISPTEDTVIVNLHRWNGEKSISEEAYNFAESINITLLTMEAYYRFVHKIK